MHHFATTLCAATIAIVVVAGTAFTPSPAEAAKTSGADAAALKDYHIDVSLLRRELNMSGLRKYTPEETGCLQNVYCEEM